MVDLNYLKRLGLHGGRLGWRLLLILGSISGVALVSAMKNALATAPDSAEQEEHEYGYLDAYGTPDHTNTTDAQWEAYYGDA